jgi:hypothetical protein
MGTIHTTWSVRLDDAVTPGDLASDGSIGDDAVRGWIDRAVHAYVDQCHILEATRARDGLVVRVTGEAPVRASRLAAAPQVLVTATATEVFPDRFVVAVRVRPVGGDDDHPLDVSRSVELVDPGTVQPQELGTEIRDELIALSHAARHYN